MHSSSSSRPTHRLFGPRSERGSALLTVAIFSSVVVLMIGSLISYSLTERRMNIRHGARMEARNAAEALVEYGASQIRQKYETRGTFTLNPNGTDALVMPPTSWWAGSKVITTASDLTQATYPPASSTNLELIGGTEIAVSTNNDGGQYYVDPADENNADDPLKGKWVTRRDVSVIGRATVTPPSRGRPITAYVSQRLSVRGAPLFAHAIFYNMDLEIFNGPSMTISGPVHTNGNLYVYPDAELNFRGNVSTAGNIYKAGKPGDNADGLTAAGRSGSINFLNRAGNLVNLRGKDVVSGGTTDFWRDSTAGTGTTGTSFANFAANASQVWNGYLQTKDHNIQNYTPAAVGKYVEDPTPTNGVDDSVNSGRAIVEPPAIPASSDPNYALKMEVEKQKYANMAGVYITVTPGTGAISLSRRGLNTDGSLKPVKNLVLPPGTATSKLVEFKPYTRIANASNEVRTYSYPVANRETRTQNGQTQYRFRRSYVPTVTPSTNTTFNSAGQTTVTAATGSPVVGAAVLENTYTGWSTSVSAPTPPAAGTVVLTANTVTSGMYDQHRAKPLDLVEIDIAALRDVVTEMQKAKSARDATKAIAAASPSEDFTVDDWNGVVYVDVQGGPTTRVVDESTSLKAGSTVAATNSLNTNTAVRVVNGVGKVPSYDGNGSPGLTIASNAPIYIKGNYNTTVPNNTAPSTSGGRNPATDLETGEVPAAFASDAISVISAGFNDATSFSVSKPASSGHILIAAAFLTGIAPTNKNGNGATSGGAHNIIRFLEAWGHTTWFRGSLVSLFESRIFTEPHGGSYYGAPTRNWGFSQLYGQGIYPPGTPRVLSYRRVGFTDLTEREYATIRDSFNWKAPVTTTTTTR